MSASKALELFFALFVCNSKQMLHSEPQQVRVITGAILLPDIIVRRFESELVEDAEISHVFQDISVVRNSQFVKQLIVQRSVGRW